MKDGFLKAAALSPALRVADCAYNVQQIAAAAHAAAARGVKLAVFPEFCLTGYTCGDLFLQRTLQTGALDALCALLQRVLQEQIAAGVACQAELGEHGQLHAPGGRSLQFPDDLTCVIDAVRHPQRGREGCCFQKSIFHRRISHPVCCVWPRRTDGPLWCT